MLLAGHVRQPVLGVALDEFALERDIDGRLVAVRTEEVSDGKMANLMTTSGLADMEVMRPRAPGGLLKK